VFSCSPGREYSQHRWSLNLVVRMGRQGTRKMCRWILGRGTSRRLAYANRCVSGHGWVACRSVLTSLIPQNRVSTIQNPSTSLHVAQAPNTPDANGQTRGDGCSTYNRRLRVRVVYTSTRGRRWMGRHATKNGSRPVVAAGCVKRQR
jgi:hypothetical protein